MSVREPRAPHPRTAARARAAALLTLLLGLPALAGGDAQAPAGGAWQNMRSQLYGARPIGESGEELSIEAPASTPDPAATPVVIRFGSQLSGHVRQLRVIIDNNPSPLVATMTLTAGVPLNEIDLRVRIDRFTSVRAIAETQDGRLEMRSTWVNASGGCSSPPNAAAAGALGQIRFHASEDGRAVQVSVRHPNNSGFQIDPRSGDPIPPHFIAHIRLLAAGVTVLQADTGISISENPTLRITSTRPLGTPLTFEATDIPSQQLFTATWTGGSASAGSR
jgi:sulfur-oxidizing protein SoxY